MERADWDLLPGIVMDEKLACDVAKIACALKSLSVYTVATLEEDEAPELLHNTVEEGIEAIKRIFIW